MGVYNQHEDGRTMAEILAGWTGGPVYDPALGPVILVPAERRPTMPRPARRRRKLSASKTLRILRRDGFRCRKCGTSDDLTVDHILAVANGGGDEDGNLQTLCRSHNSSKGARQ